MTAIALLLAHGAGTPECGVAHAASSAANAGVDALVLYGPFEEALAPKLVISSELRNELEDGMREMDM